MSRIKRIKDCLAEELQFAKTEQDFHEMREALNQALFMVKDLQYMLKQKKFKEEKGNL